MKSLFGTSGVRGNVKKVFTDQFCFDLGRTFAQFLDNYQQVGSIAIGIDSRESSPRISKFLMKGLQQSNKHVSYHGAIPVPACHNTILSTPAVASIMITGSHIDLLSNGVKFFAFNEEISKKHEQEITDIYNNLEGKTSYPAEEPELPPLDPSGFNNYVKLLISLAKGTGKKYKIVVDPGNGVQTEVVGQVLEKLGHNLVMINGDLKKELLSRDTEADGSFKELQGKVVSENADFGIGFDTDGDRIIFVDHLGQFISGDYSGTLMAKHSLSDSIVVPINVGNVINSIGKKIIRTRVGSPFVVAAMKENNADFGFESNGGGIHKEVMLSRDGGTSMIKVLNLLSLTKKSLSQLISELPQYFLRKQKFDCPTEKNSLILEQAKNFTETKSVDTTDGLKLIIDDHNWVLFRPSSNAPEFRVFVEANSKEKADKLLADALTFAQNLIN
jgi:phosphomannomutase / phosphoglucomutase